VDYVALSRDLAHGIESGVYIAQSKKFVYVNPFFEKLTGYSSEELIGSKCLSLVLPKDRAAVRKKAIRNLKSRKGTKPYEYRFIKKNGEVMWVLERISSIEYMGQKAALGSFMDIDERKHLEEALVHSEERYRMILEEMLDPYYEVDLSGNFTFVNNATCQNLGYSSEELIGKNFHIIVPQEERKTLYRAFNTAYRTGETNKGFAHRIIRKDGTTGFAESSVSFLKNDHGEVIGFRSVSRDVTERRRLDEVLLQEKYFTDAVIDSLPGTFYVVDENGVFVRWNKNEEKVTGYSAEELSHMNGLDTIAEEDRELVANKLADVFTKGYVNEEVTIQTKDGRKIPYDLTGVSAVIGGKTYLLGMGTDITEGKEAEKARRKIEERYRTISRLSSEFAYSCVHTGDNGYKVDWITDAFFTLTGYSEAELREKGCWMFISHPDDHEIATRPLRELKAGESDTREFRIVIKNGRILYIINHMECQADPGAPGGLRLFGAVQDITERRKGEKAIKESEERYLALFDRSLDLVFVRDFKGNFIDANPAALNLLGYRREDIPTLNIVALLSKDQYPKTLQTLKDLTETGRQKEPTEYKLKCKDGRHVDVEVQESVIYRDGKSYAVQGIGRDVTERKRLEETLARSEERYRNILENMQDSYFEVDLKGNFTFVNDATCLNLGHPREDLIGNNFRIIMSENEAKAVFQAYHTVYLSGEPNKGFAFEVRRKDGAIGFAESSITLLKNELGETVGFRCVGRDVTERKQMEQKLAEMATHDFLTGLPNRNLLVDRFAVAAALAHRKNNRLAVMSLDLDRFKPINDTLGHSAGDRVLKGVSMRLTSIIRASDTVARVGGDEFILVMLETNHINDATAIAQKILDSFKEPFIIDGHELNISTSVGIAVYPEDGQDLETVMNKSDAAMYYAKGHGRSQFKFFGDGDVYISGKHKSV